EVFGGWQSVVRITLDADKLQALRISANQISQAITAWNRNVPEGLVNGEGTQILLKNEGEALRAEELGNIVVRSTNGQPVYLRDVATIREGVQERQSVYHGNGKPA